MSFDKNYVFDEWLAAYAAGQLSVGPSVMIAAHLDLCPEILPRLNKFEAVGGRLLDNLSPCENVGYPLLGDLLNRIEHQEETFPDFRSEIGTRQKEKNDGIFPRSIQKFLGYDFQQARWRFAGAGSMISHLWQDSNNGRLWMFRSRAGTVTPIHTHSGKEWTLILQGGYSTIEGDYRPADLHQVDETHEHQPIMHAGEDCICLVFTEGPTIYSQLLPKMMQRYTGI